MTFKHLKYLSILAACHMAFIQSAQAEEIGINTLVKGSVSIKSVDSETAKPAIVKAPVSLGDEVRSEQDSSLQILLKDETVFTVGAQADLTIDEFVYDPRANNNKITASVKRGMFRYMSGNTSKTNPDDIVIKTPTASMGIRGTIFEAIVGPEALVCAQKEGLINSSTAVDYNGATLIVLRGPGGQTNTNSRQGEIVVTSGGKSVTLSQSGSATLVSNDYTEPSKVFLISDQLYNYFNRNLRSEPNGDENFMPFDPDPRIIRPEIIIEDNDEAGFLPFDPIEDLDVPSRNMEFLEEEFFDDNINDFPTEGDGGISDQGTGGFQDFDSGNSDA